jgi:hypothetical protein
MESSYRLRLSGVSADKAQILAADLEDALLDADPSIEVTRQQERSDAQDFGAVLAIVLGAPAVVAIAESLGAWLQRHHEVVIRIETSDGILVVENVTAASAPELIRAFKEKTK